MFEQQRRERLRSPEQRVGTLPNGALPPPENETTEELLARALLGRDEQAFEEVLDRLFSRMMRIALTHVRSRAEAEEVVQETWLAALRGVGRFEHRSSLLTWLLRILKNRARTHGVRAARTIAFTDLEAGSAGTMARLDPVAPMWSTRADTSFAGPQERALLARELGEQIDRAIGVLPPRQREVVTLRDVDGHTSADVCALLGLTDANQRVLLHRARSSIREQLAGYLASAPGPACLARSG